MREWQAAISRGAGGLRSSRAVVLVALLALVTGAAGAAPSPAPVAIVGARVYVSPDERPLDDATVLLRDGRIVAVGPSARLKPPRGTRVIDGGGRTVVAGFWNSHVHLMTDALQDAQRRPAPELAAALRELALRWGFTHVFDLGSLLDNTLALRRRIESGEIDGPAILTTGDPFYPAGGTPVYVRDWYARNRAPSSEVDTPAAARTRAAAQLERGADGVKVFTGAIVGGSEGVRPMQREIAAAAVAPARERGRPGFSHPTTVEGLRIAMDAGVGILVHTTPTGGPWPPALARELAERDVALIPTLALFQSELEKEGAPREVVDRFVTTAQQQVRALREAGGTLLFGTDVGYIPLTDPTLEYRLLAGAGLDARAILAMLTTAPAVRYGEARRHGRVAKGYIADLVILGSDPEKDVAALADVVCTLRAGRVVYAREASATAPARRGSGCGPS